MNTVNIMINIVLIIYLSLLAFKTDLFLKNYKQTNSADDRRPIMKVTFRVIGIMGALALTVSTIILLFF